MSAIERNNVRVSGAGRDALLLAHGFGCDASVWRPMVPMFEPDHRVIVFDHMGFGGSDPAGFDPVRHGSLHGYAEDVLDICRELGLSKVVFVGHSVSATLGILAAIKAPSQFASLVLVTPSPRYVNDGEYVGGFTGQSIDELLDLLDSNPEGWARAMAPVIMGNPKRPELSVELTELFCRMDPVIGKRFARLCFLSDVRAELPEVRTPSLVLQCSEDALVPPVVGDYIRTHLPFSRFVLLRATGHCPHLSAPDETAAAIRTFLASRPD